MKTIALYVVVGFSGIIFVTANVQGNAGCNQRTFQSTCCSDDSVHYNDTINKICSACIGLLCRPKCPHGYYEDQCNETCTCDADACDDVFGCVTTEKTSTSLDDMNTEEEKQGKPLGMVFKISLSASIFIIVLLLGILLNVVYRARKNSTRYPEVSTGRSATNEDITRDSPVIYAAVVRPNRTPVRSVDQNDRMYGNMLKLQKRNRGRKKKAKISAINTCNNAINEESPQISYPATYSYVGHPDRISSLGKGHPDRTLSLDVGHPDSTLSLDKGQYDEEYGNMTMC